MLGAVVALIAIFGTGILSAYLSGGNDTGPR